MARQVSDEALERLRGAGPCVMGIDEAGRGPVLGPMVYACFFCPEASEKLQGAGYADSKTLTEKQREQLFQKIAQSGHGYRAVPLHASSLSAQMLRRARYNLNLISHDAAAALIQWAIDRGVNITRVYLDTVGDPGKYQRKLSDLFPSVTVVVEKKADSKFPVVSAASICAKVLRDDLLANWNFEEPGLTPSRVFGSGYPGDPKTKQWLERHCDPVFGYPSLIRFSWKTVDNALEANDACKVFFGDEEEEAKEDVVVPTHKYAPKKKRARYFTEREMDVANDF